MKVLRMGRWGEGLVQRGREMQRCRTDPWPHHISPPNQPTFQYLSNLAHRHCDDRHDDYELLTLAQWAMMPLIHFFEASLPGLDCNYDNADQGWGLFGLDCSYDNSYQGWWWWVLTFGLVSWFGSLFFFVPIWLDTFSFSTILNPCYIGVFLQKIVLFIGGPTLTEPILQFVCLIPFCRCASSWVLVD